MRKSLMAAGIAGLILTCTPAQAASVIDATGDFLPGYIGPHQADLDVTAFSVGYDSANSRFLLSATMAGPIDLNLGGFYVIGVNTGPAVAPGPFAGIGQPNVIFNTVIILRKTGASTANGNPVTPFFNGATVSVVVPLSLLPAAANGFTPMDFGFNIWPRSGAGGVNVISDFAPENANLTAVPEPASWALLLAGFGAAGAALRSRRRMTTLRYA
ncbi:hypothetical protein FHS91_002436 [Sphingobium xanthum]|jgi:hypothetical protein|uniref:PEPxxWA-CTERM sorting domain-containing protein n=1 Tax=Sphingobium xanthum TaxID=1387165 RepID=UPI001FEBD204|nr:PEPxxWA-CTERM sorting domain-containing protein [Sphingobium xanthum]